MLTANAIDKLSKVQDFQWPNGEITGCYPPFGQPQMFLSQPEELYVQRVASQIAAELQSLDVSGTVAYQSICTSSPSPPHQQQQQRRFQPIHPSLTSRMRPVLGRPIDATKATIPTGTGVVPKIQPELKPYCVLCRRNKEPK